MRTLKEILAIGFITMATPAIAAKTTTPKIGGLINTTSTDYIPENGPPCTAILRVGYEAVFDRTKSENPVINIDGKDVFLRVLQIKYQPKPLAAQDELLQDILERDDLKVVVDYKVLSSNYEGANYEAVITASRKFSRKNRAKKLQSQVKAYGVFGCPRQP